MTVTTLAPWRLFRPHVASVHALSPSLRRVRLVGPELADFADPGYDQRIKLLIGGREQPDPATEDWYAAWRALPERDRPAMRTYTTRRVSVWGGGIAVDVDMVVHDHAGPAGDWVRRAVPGDEVVVVGPDARFDGDPGGRTFAPPAGVRDVVLVGDETALPAIGRILEDLREGHDLTGRSVRRGAVASGCRVTAIVEVPEPSDCLDLVRPDGAEVVWLVRGPRPMGVALDRAVRTWTMIAAGPAAEVRPGTPAGLFKVGVAGSAVGPDDDVLWDVPTESPGSPGSPDSSGLPGSPLPRAYVWVAGETGVVRGIRRHLLSEVGLDRSQVALMGYWRLGRALG